MAIIYSCGNSGQCSNEQNADSLATAEQPADNQTAENALPEKELSDAEIKDMVFGAFDLLGEEVFTKDMKTVGNEKIMAFAERFEEDGDKIYIVVCDLAGNIKSKLSYMRQPSAEKLEELSIMDNPYKVKEDVQLIGVVSHCASFGYSSMICDDVSIFTVEDNNINEVLKDCTIKYGSSVIESSTKIVPDTKSKSADGFYKLKLITTEFDIDGAGSKIESSKQETIRVMKYINGTYKEEE